MNAADMIAAFAKSNPAAARVIFDRRIAAETNADRRAELEIAREYHCNPEFKVALEGATYRAQ